MKTNKEFIEGIYNKADEISKEKAEKKSNNISKIINMAAILVIIFCIGVNVNIHQKGQKENIKIEEKTIGLTTVNDFANFCSIIKNSKQAQDYNKYMEKEDTSIEVGEINDSTNESITNTQVENVDEADIVKVYQNYIYYVTGNRIVIVDAHKAQDSSKIAEINYEEEFSPSEIYVNKNKLVVVSEGNDYKTSTMINREISSIKNKTIILIYDISNKNTPKEIRRIEVDGEYLSSRMIENNIYFATSKYINTSEILNETEAEIDEQNYKPKYKDTVISKETKCIEYDDVYCFNQIDTTNYLIVAGLNIEENKEVEIQTFLGAGEYIYSSEKNMYIAKTNVVYEKGIFKSANTHILKFALSNGSIIFQTEVAVEGQINNQFSMDENGEYFRIATTTGDTWKIDENTSNNIFVLNNKLEEIGKVTGFGKEEKIYSVRYTEDKAYVVTYKRTDPLFVIDLSVPSNPQILGELKIPGYSTYLHQYDETHLIGFGYDTKEDGTLITTNGLKMVMFDISDVNNPKELYKVTIGDQNTNSELIYNHKALLYSRDNNIIAFPLATYARKDINSRVAIYEIDLDKGFILKGEISNKITNYENFIERIVYVDNAYYTLSYKFIKVVSMDTLNLIKEIEI
ncbi:MAG: hypothetical protein HFJ47_04320 [Clostridia bacterium]|nr:hypothetical protein [Clostridia bacterium]